MEFASAQEARLVWCVVKVVMLYAQEFPPALFPLIMSRLWCEVSSQRPLRALPPHVSGPGARSRLQSLPGGANCLLNPFNDHSAVIR